MKGEAEWSSVGTSREAIRKRQMRGFHVYGEL